ncbi:muconate/chloromuconate family cycloisomerase [Rufibacter glacialis]|uniref:Muconate cycloisomerase n=1 Tax=Rufibacter glacialis TaxID=1259555 RepID=A0A5M8QJQ4_9BACT|nr:muconate/chloromuconate family cycloisomerase [Rufibacter glacialis]KAA6435391.1 muconate cycloisomerase [Rufibacter glacialis]GGK63012.1 muconate cycloisomerase I [Rufibacter glacialis]
MGEAFIERIEAVIVDLPTIRPHLLSMAVMRKQTMVIVRLFCSDGIEGLGEATTIGGLSYGDESPEGMKLTIDTYVAPLLQGKPAGSANALMALLNYHIQGNYFVKSALETAVLDAQGKRLGVPVAALLGGAITQTLPVLWTLASGDTTKDIQEAQNLISSGRHHTFKLKIGRNAPKTDIAHVSAIKATLGSDIKVTVDVNQAWSEGVAKQGIAQLQEAGIDLIEQPIIKSNFEGLARLTHYFRVPIMADEAAGTVADAFKLAKLGGGSVFALKIAKSGGLINIQKQAAIALGAGISLYGGTMLEGTIGTVASAQVFSTLPNLDWGTELFGPLLLTDDIVKKRVTYANGGLEIPQGPGLGLELDLNQVEKYKRK